MKLFFLRAIGTNSVNGDFKTFRLEPARQRQRLRRQIQIENRLAFAAMKMAVLVHIRTKPRRASVNRHLPRQTRFHQRIEAVVNRRVRNFRHRFFRADENFFRRRMIALRQQHVINLLTLRRQAQTRRAQLFRQVQFVWMCFARFHRER